jgi:hypothetical protein
MLAMRKKFGWLLVAGALLLGRPSASAFSFTVYPPADWQDATIGYDPAPFPGVGNIGEEFRWNVPTLYYACDSTFVNYFGSRGIEEVEKVMAILNAVPRASDINLDSIPSDTRRPNARAQALGMLDLKSYVLGLMVDLMGLAPSPRYVFTLRERVDLPSSCCDYWYVIRRNFDPYTRNVSSYINGQLWTYRDIFCSCTPVQVAWTINEHVDPLAYGEPVSAMLRSNPAYVSRFAVGQFYTGLTRDDVGGLKYVYRKLNQNFEPAVLGATGGSGPWGPPPGTNGVNPNFINTALRYGVEKLNFVRCDFDSLFGELFVPITNRYEELVITNGIEIKQYVDRVIYLPDIIFIAADTATYSASSSAITLGSGTSNSFTLSLTGRGGGSGAVVFLNPPVKNPNSVTSASGPGTFQPVNLFVLNNSGPLLYNVNGFFIAETNAITVYNWGSFSTSTNIFVYPDGASVEDMERMVLQSGTGGTVWGPPGYVPTGQGVLPGDTGGGGGG